MRPSDVTKLLASLIVGQLPLLLVGPPGVGKSDLVAQAVKAAKADLILSHPVVEDPTNAKGLPWPSKDGKSATFLPFGELHRALTAKKLTVWFLDDLGQAPPSVQAAYMQLLLARRVNGHVLPDCVTFVAASNRRTDRAGVSGILEPVKSRFTSIVEVDPNLDDWCQWAIDAGLPAELIAFIRFRPELLHAFNPTADLVNSPCPRTWSNVGKLMALNLGRSVEFGAYRGAVGEGPATELIAFLRVYRELPSLDGILIDPLKAKIPDDPAALYCVSVGLATKATPSNFARIAQYAQRLYDEKRGEFATLTIRDCIRRNDQICNTPAFIKLASSDMGKLLIGQEV